ncbi:MAG: FtsX-like permease family protein [Muribaculaceae bacterium]|nr:FtsX-like permease family protein [Muribaculaceae bacterium]
MILHNLKVACRNLMKYKLQTLISVVSIAIGIVTLSFAHSALLNFRLSAIYDEPYAARAYELSFTSNDEQRDERISLDIIRAVKRDGGPVSAEQIAVPQSGRMGMTAVFLLSDSTVRKGEINAEFIDPAYPNYAGFRSALTGKKIKKLRPGEAIIGEDLAKTIFCGKNPIGAVQTRTYDFQPMPVTIVDVYKSLPANERNRGEDALYFCIADKIEDQNLDNYFFAMWINVVLREGYTEQQLLQEVKQRVEPLGLEPHLSNVLKKDDVRFLFTLKSIYYIISSLILLAASIGFIRLQTQLFRLRRRELSLRNVNGASRLQLFGLLIVEVAITIALSIVVAVVLGILLQDFLNTDLVMIADSGIKIKDLWLYSLVIGGVLFLICSMIAYFTLLRICNATRSIAANMHRSRNHIFRNAMLGIQLTISLVFICSTLILARGGEKMLERNNIPENDDFYNECLSLCISNAANMASKERLINEINRLPDLDKVIKLDHYYSPIKEIEENPAAKQKFEKNNIFMSYITNDTTALSFLGMDVNWFNRDVNKNECVLISENMYLQLQELDVIANNTLTIDGRWDNETITIPIAGTFKRIPYEQRENSLLLISKYWDKRGGVDYVLVPQKGRGKALLQSVNETIERLEPTAINKMVFNFRNKLNPFPLFVKSILTGVWILAAVSLIICAMSIFSTIALDTRGRRKEVAIRKVNGAKSKDIYRMFGRVYIILIAISLFIAVPISVILNRGVTRVVYPEASGVLSPVGPIILGIAIVTLLILLIVGWQIHRVMQVDPAKIIAKE